MKKILSGLMVGAAAVMLVGCGNSVPENKVFSVDDLSGKKVGVQIGTTGDIYITDDETITPERYNKGADAIQALKQGKIDAVVIDEQPAKAFVSKNDDLKILDDVFADEDYAICIAKDNTLTEEFNKAIQTLKDDGTLDAIIKSYIGDEASKDARYVTDESVDRSNGVITMATNAAFEPYEFYEGQDIVGIDVDLAQAICDQLGYELKIEDMEFDSIIAAVSSGKADFGASGMTVTEDRKKNIDFTDSYTTARQVIVVREK